MRCYFTLVMCILATCASPVAFASRVPQVSPHDFVSIYANIPRIGEPIAATPLTNTWLTPTVSPENIYAEQFSLFLIAIGVFLIWLAGQSKNKKDRD